MDLATTAEVSLDDELDDPPWRLSQERRTDDVTFRLVVLARVAVKDFVSHTIARDDGAGNVGVGAQGVLDDPRALEDVLVGCEWIAEADGGLEVRGSDVGQGLVCLEVPAAVVGLHRVPVLLPYDDVFIERGVNKEPHLLVLTSHALVGHGGREGVGGVSEGDEVRLVRVRARIQERDVGRVLFVIHRREGDVVDRDHLEVVQRREFL